jgi:8-oxo-dGTP diphosphatase
VIWRPTGTAHVEVLVVHRRRQQDWSLPKGSLRRGETALACAIREVREETGLRCTVDAELPELLYRDRRGRDRRVRYWAMRARDGEFRCNKEVDEIQWLPTDTVDELLTTGRDLLVVSWLRRNQHRRRLVAGRRRSDLRASTSGLACRSVEEECALRCLL